MKYMLFFVVGVFIFCCTSTAKTSGNFIHPGGLHTQADLDRMRTKVAEAAQPWIDGWNLLIRDPLAQSDYKASPKENMNARQVLSNDAHAAYLNAIRWYISGDDCHAQCAIRILNDYSSVVRQIPTKANTEFYGLGGIGISEMAMAAEIMRIYDGWKSEDLRAFQHMMVEYFYPVCHDFLVHHNGACVDYYWANWDANNITALLAIGVLCDNPAIFDEGVEYFKHGKGTGSIKHAVYHVHEGNLGQWQESGRDQEHGQLGVGLLGTACQIAWNQGVDLFGYDNNRLLAGAEYTAKYNMMQDVPFKFYNNCQPANHRWPAINGRGRLDDRPVWELLYNHYVVRMGEKAPNVQRMAELLRPERGSKDHFGYGSLTFALEASSVPPHPAPGQPKALEATAGVGRVFLSWQPPVDYTTTGYIIQRSIRKEGDFTTLASWDDLTLAEYTDKTASNGITYYYRVAAQNQSGAGVFSEVTQATPKRANKLPMGWNIAQIGSGNAGKAAFADVAGSTYQVTGYGTQIGGNKDNASFCFTQVRGDFEFTGRISDVSGPLMKIGLMLRSSLDPGSPAVSMTLGEGGGRFARMGYRLENGVSMSSTLGNTYTWLPAWFRIKRTGAVFTVFESSNGQKWFEVDRVEIPMESSILAGLVVASSDSNKPVEATFDHVSIHNDLGIQRSNPILEGYYADPSIVFYAGVYYIYATIDPWGGEELAVFETRDFQSFERRQINWPTKEACTSPTSGKDKVWAPSVIQGVNGQFYMYVSVGNEVWAGVAEHPLGPWKNAKSDNTPLIPGNLIPGYHMIDAECFIDDDNQAYLYWGSGLNWVNGKCFMVSLDTNMIDFLIEPLDVTPPDYFEGPVMLKKDGMYYLMYSNGKAIDHTYNVRYATAKSPFGPFEKGKNNPILQTSSDRTTYGPGHHCVFMHKNQHYMLYHRIFPQEESYVLRQLCLAPLDFDQEGHILPITP